MLDDSAAVTAAPPRRRRITGASGLAGGLAEGGGRRHRSRDLAARRLVGLAARVRPAATGDGVPATRRAHRRRHRGECARDHPGASGVRVHARPRDRDRHRRPRLVVEDRAIGRRLLHHGPADHAVDRLVPARHPPVRAVRAGDPLRRRARRRALDRQRAHHRRRPRAPGPPAGRSHDGSDRHLPVPPRGAARRRCRRSSVASSRAGRSPGGA